MPPPNNDRANAQVLNIGPGWGEVQGTTVDATNEPDEDWSSFESVWYVLRDLPAGPIYFKLYIESDEYAYFDGVVYLGEPTSVGKSSWYETYFYQYIAGNGYVEGEAGYFDHPGGTITIGVGNYTGDPQLPFALGWGHGSLDTDESHWSELITPDWSTLTPNNDTSSKPAPTVGWVDGLRGRWNHRYDVDPVTSMMHPPKPVNMGEEQKAQWAAQHGNDGSSVEPTSPPSTPANGLAAVVGAQVGYSQWNSSNSGFYTNDRRCEYLYYATGYDIYLGGARRATSRILPEGAWGARFIDANTSDFDNFQEEIRNLSFPIIWQQVVGPSGWPIKLQRPDEIDEIPYQSTGEPPAGKWWLHPSGFPVVSWPVNHSSPTDLATLSANQSTTLEIPDPDSLSRAHVTNNPYGLKLHIPLMAVAQRALDGTIDPISDDGITRQIYAWLHLTFAQGSIEHRLPSHQFYMGFPLSIKSKTLIPMRQRARDDGLSTDARQQKGYGSSRQLSIRQGGRTYY